MSGANHADDAFDSYLDVHLLVGAWADTTVVRRERDMFTVDFIRRSPRPDQRILVSRVLVSPVTVAELRDQLDAGWRAYLGWSMPEDG